MTNIDPASINQINLLLQSEKNLYTLKNRFEHIVERLTVLQKVSQNLIKTQTITDIISNTTLALTTQMNLEKCVIILNSSTNISIASHSGYTLAEKDKLSQLNSSQLIQIFDTVKAHPSAMLSDSNQYLLSPELADLIFMNIYFSAIISHDGVPIGCIFAGYSKQNAVLFSKQVLINTEDTTWFSFLVDQVSAAITNRNLIANLTSLNHELESRVKLRTEEVNKKVSELEKINTFMINRELKMVELKNKISQLEALNQRQPHL